MTSSRTKPAPTKRTPTRTSGNHHPKLPRTKGNLSQRQVGSVRLYRVKNREDGSSAPPSRKRFNVDAVTPVVYFGIRKPSNPSVRALLTRANARAFSWDRLHGSTQFVVPPPIFASAPRVAVYWRKHADVCAGESCPRFSDLGFDRLTLIGKPGSSITDASGGTAQTILVVDSNGFLPASVLIVADSRSLQAQ
jgi:hypothetical protein